MNATPQSRSAAAPHAELPERLPSAAVLGALLERLGATFQGPELEQALQRAESARGGDSARRVHDMLANLSIGGVQSAILGWRRLDQRQLPVLAAIDGQWQLVEHDPGRQGLLLFDGVDRLPVSEEALRDSAVLWIRMRGSRPIQAPGMAFRNRAASLVWAELFRDSGWLTSAVLATVIVNMLAIASSLFAMQVYDRVVPTLAYATLATLVAGMALVIVLDWVLRVWRARILDSMACAVDKRVSQRVFDHLTSLRLDLMPRSLGTLAAQVGSLESVRQFAVSGVVFGLVDLPFALVFIGAIGFIGGPLALVYTGLFAVAVAVGFLTQWRLRKLLREEVQRSNERQGLLVDTIRAAESIRAANGTWRFSEQWRGLTDSIAESSIQHKALSNVSSVSTASLSSIAYVLVIVGGVWLIEAGQLTTGGLIACGILGGRVIAPVTQAVQYLLQWQMVTQSLRLVDAVLAIETERKPDQTLLVPESPAASIGVERIRFSYPGSPVMQIDIPELEFRAGDRVLLLGPVGCGKSTLLKILAGLYKPSEGRVRLGGVDLWEIDPLVVHANVGYLPQTVHLFKGSLRSNLALSDRVGDERLIRVTRALGVDRIAAESPLGMDLEISEGGEGLSGGQRQLVALARLAIGEPVVWLLDEPTASLDIEGDERVWRTLQAQLRPQDILVVATHRPMQAMAIANRVVVMAGGRVLRDGDPESTVPQIARAAGRSRMPDQVGRTAGGNHGEVA